MEGEGFDARAPKMKTQPSLFEIRCRCSFITLENRSSRANSETGLRKLTAT